MNWKSTGKLWRQQLNKIKAQTITPFDYVIWSVLDNKTDTTSNLNFRSLNTATEEEKDKIPKNLLWTHANRFEGGSIQQWKNVFILSKFTVLCLSYFVVYF